MLKIVGASVTGAVLSPCVVACHQEAREIRGAASFYFNGYFFKGGEYARYDLVRNTVDAGYPRSIVSGWPGLWESGINAAALWTGGKACFFQGDKYILYDVWNRRESTFEDVVDGLRTVYELLFTIVLAFVIGAVLGTFGTAEAKVSSEATKLAQMVRASRDIAPDQRRVFNNAIGEYVHAIADDEFITMRNGEAIPLASIALDNLYGIRQKYTPNPGEELTYEMSLSALDEVTAMRRDRVLQSAANLPALLRILLAIGLIVLLILEYRPKFPTVDSQLIHIAFIAIIASSSVLLTILLDYPFAGEVSVSNAPFKQGALAQFWPSP